MIKSRRIKWTGPIVNMEEEITPYKVYEVYVGEILAKLKQYTVIYLQNLCDFC
jgi:hypothetical protein